MRFATLALLLCLGCVSRDTTPTQPPPAGPRSRELWVVSTPTGCIACNRMHRVCADPAVRAALARYTVRHIDPRTDPASVPPSVTAIPAFVIYADGKLIAQLDGFHNRDRFLSWLHANAGE